MDDAVIVEVAFRDRIKIEIVEAATGVPGSTRFYVHENGKRCDGSYATAEAALAAAMERK